MIAPLEAVSFLLLLVAAVVKRVGDEPIGVEILGPIHGILFIGYVVNALSLRSEEGWDNRLSAIILAASVIPTGGFFADRYLSERSSAGSTSAE